MSKKSKKEKREQICATVQITPETEKAIRALMHSFPESARSRGAAIRYLCDSALETGKHASYPQECVRRTVELVRHFHPEFAPLVKELLGPLATRWELEMRAALSSIGGVSSD